MAKNEVITIPTYIDRETGAAWYWLGMVDRMKERGAPLEEWENYFDMVPKEVKLPPDTRPRYHVTCLDHGYDVTGDEWDRDRAPEVNLEMVWRSEECWYTPGRRVLIEDENGNKQIFTKEV